MTKEQLLAKCPVVLVSYKTPEGLVCNANAILLNHIHAAFEDTRATDHTCFCGRNCAAIPGDNVHFCINKDCGNFHVYIPNTNGHCK